MFVLSKLIHGVCLQSILDTKCINKLCMMSDIIFMQQHQQVALKEQPVTIKTLLRNTTFEQIEFFKL
jgi:hypothetical protein